MRFIISRSEGGKAAAHLRAEFDDALKLALDFINENGPGSTVTITDTDTGAILNEPNIFEIAAEFRDDA